MSSNVDLDRIKKALAKEKELYGRGIERRLHPNLFASVQSNVQSIAGHGQGHSSYSSLVSSNPTGFQSIARSNFASARNTFSFNVHEAENNSLEPFDPSANYGWTSPANNTVCSVSSIPRSLSFRSAHQVFYQDMHGEITNAILSRSTLLGVNLEGHLNVMTKDYFLESLRRFGALPSEPIQLLENGDTDSVIHDRNMLNKVKREAINAFKNGELRQLIDKILLDGAFTLVLKKKALGFWKALLLGSLLICMTLCVLGLYSHMLIELNYSWPDEYAYAVDMLKMMLPLLTYAFFAHFLEVNSRIWLFLVCCLSVAFLSNMQPTEYVPTGIDSLTNERIFHRVDLYIKKQNSYMTGLNPLFSALKIDDACHRHSASPACIKALSELHDESAIYRKAVAILIKDNDIGLPKQVKARYKYKSEYSREASEKTYTWKWEDIKQEEKNPEYNLALRAFLQVRLLQGQMVEKFYQKPHQILQMLSKGLEMTSSAVMMATDAGLPLLIPQFLGLWVGYPVAMGMWCYTQYLKIAKVYVSSETLFWMYDQVLKLYNGYRIPTRMELIEHYFKNSVYNSTEEWKWVQEEMFELCRIWVCEQPTLTLPVVQDVVRTIESRKVTLTKNQDAMYRETEQEMDLSTCPYKNPEELANFMEEFEKMADNARLCKNVYSKVCDVLKENEVSKDAFCPDHCKQVFFGGTFLNITGGVKYQKERCKPCVQQPCVCPEAPAEGTCGPKNQSEEEQPEPPEPEEVPIDFTDHGQEDITVNFTDDSVHRQVVDASESFTMHVWPWISQILTTGICMAVNYAAWCYLFGPQRTLPLLQPSHELQREWIKNKVFKKIAANIAADVAKAASETVADVAGAAGGVAAATASAVTASFTSTIKEWSA